MHIDGHRHSPQLLNPVVLSAVVWLASQILRFAQDDRVELRMQQITYGSRSVLPSLNAAQPVWRSFQW